MGPAGPGEQSPRKPAILGDPSRPSFTLDFGRSSVLKLIQSSNSQRARRGPTRGDDLAHLAAAVVRGEPRAARTFIIALGPHLLRVVRRVLGPSHPDVEDVAQEASYALLEALPKYRNECSVLHFACRIAVLTAMNTRRRDEAAKRTALRRSTHGVEGIATHEPSPDATMALRATAAAVRGLLSTLPEQQAETLALHCVVGFTVSEIASSAGVSAETVRSRLRLGRRALRERLKSDPHLQEMVQGSR